MRKWIAAAACLGIAACSESAPEKKAPETPALLPAGTWTVTSEVTAFRPADKGTPVVQAKVGDKASATVCVDKASKEPPPELFAPEGDVCTYKSSHIKDGFLNAELDCRRDGVQGSILTSVSGSYTATGFEGSTDTTSFLTQDGRYQISRKIAGTLKPGACMRPAGDGDDAEDANKSGG